MRMSKLVKVCTITLIMSVAANIAGCGSNTGNETKKNKVEETSAVEETTAEKVEETSKKITNPKIEKLKELVSDEKLMYTVMGAFFVLGDASDFDIETTAERVKWNYIAEAAMCHILNSGSEFETKTIDDDYYLSVDWETIKPFIEVYGSKVDSMNDIPTTDYVMYLESDNKCYIAIGERGTFSIDFEFVEEKSEDEVMIKIIRNNTNENDEMEQIEVGSAVIKYSDTAEFGFTVESVDVY